ncbi:DeoR/GlpR family DNA-binding transcription regulator [soil metagenome]
MQSPLPAERYRRIEDVLRERHTVRVSTLSDLLGVSEVTVRRDLELLEQRGVLERTHGGAVGTQRMGSEPSYTDALATRHVEKTLIGERAAGLVDPGDTIFLNGGTTTLEVFRHLAAPRTKVITNHAAIAYEADDKSGLGVEVVVLGGQFRSSSHSMAGPMTRQAIGTVYANKAFLGVEGISLRYGLTTPSAAEAEIARLMIERTAGDVIVVADHSKLGTVADFVIGDLDQISRLVIDAIGEEYQRGLIAAQVDVVRPAGGESRTAKGA